MLAIQRYPLCELLSVLHLGQKLNKNGHAISSAHGQDVNCFFSLQSLNNWLAGAATPPWECRLWRGIQRPSGGLKGSEVLLPRTGAPGGASESWSEPECPSLSSSSSLPLLGAPNPQVILGDKVCLHLPMNQSHRSCQETVQFTVALLP